MQDDYPREIDGMTASIIVEVMNAVKTPADAGKVYDLLCGKFDAVIDLCEAERLPQCAARDLLYPLAALADEFLMTVPAYRSRWITNPLQLRYYGEMDAGAAFFSRLEKIMAAPKDNARLLELYFICLAVGFSGKYKTGAQDELRTVFEDAGAALSETRGTCGAGTLTGYGGARGKIFTLRKILAAAFLLLTIASAAAYLSAFAGFLTLLGGIS